MMKERNDSLEVPRGAGVEGFLEIIRGLLQIPNLRSIHISSKGKVSYTWMGDSDQPDRALGVDLQTLEPYYAVRNGSVHELPLPPWAGAAVVVGALFGQADYDRLFPIAFLAGTRTKLWDWYKEGTGLQMVPSDRFYGLPLYTSHEIDESVLLLATGAAVNGSVVDIVHSYKVRMG